MAHHILAAIFDLDGLLVDSEPLQFRAWDQYLARFGRSVTPNLARKMHGRRLIDAAEVVVDELGLAITSEKVAEDRDAIFMALVPGAIEAKAGAREAVADCRELGLKVALATSGHRQYVQLALESAGLSHHFDVEVTGEMVLRGKPAPDTFLIAAELLEIEPARCLVLEDSVNGLRAALAAGMRCYVIPESAQRETDFEGADARLSGLIDVVPTLQKQGLVYPYASHG